MSIEYLPMGNKCNLKCSYCYRTPMREHEESLTPNFARVKETLSKLNCHFSLNGGEALQLPIKQLEEIFAFGLEKFGKNGIQTNGLLVTPKHIELFKNYKVQVGVSIDGHEELNAPRVGLVPTQVIIENIKLLLSSKIAVSLIVTIHRANANEKLLDFFVDMEKAGVRNINLHILEVESEKIGCEIGLSSRENLSIFEQLYEFSKKSKTSFSPFNEIIKLLTEKNPSVCCTWNSCDPLNTGAVQGVRVDGELVGCGRLNKDGIDWLKSNSQGKERTLILYNTPQEFGGCEGCEYFYICKGQCPGTAIDGDWRNRTVYCNFWFNLIRYIERDIKLSRSAQSLANDQHGDTPHGDSHGDHFDA